MDIQELVYFIYMDEQEKKKPSSSDEEAKEKSREDFPAFIC